VGRTLTAGASQDFDRSRAGVRGPPHWGVNEWKWDGRNGKGATVASGGYVLLLEARAPGETQQVVRRKIAVIR